MVDKLFKFYVMTPIMWEDEARFFLELQLARKRQHMQLRSWGVPFSYEDIFISPFAIRVVKY